MKQAAAAMIAALVTGQNTKHTNTEVDWSYHTTPNEAKVLLHGNCIARFRPPFDLTLCDCGYQTRLTKERMHHILTALKPSCLPPIWLTQVNKRWSLVYGDHVVPWAGTHHIEYKEDEQVLYIDSFPIPHP
jgi:hypothetical protein